MEPVNLDVMLPRFAEPGDVVNTGDAGGELTAEVEQLT
jgi:hypothetical protein